MLSRQTLIAVVKGLTIGTMLWCLLGTLHVLSGKMADTPGLVFIVALGLVATLARQRRLLLASLGTLAGAVLLVSLSPLMTTIAERWEREDVIPTTGVDAIVVLSGGLNPDTTVSTDAVDRLLTGLELANRGAAPVLVTTTTKEIFPAGLLNSEVDQKRILSSLVQQVAWLHAWGGNSTHDEATNVAALLRPRHLHRIAVVTSPVHTRRACAVFENVGFAVWCTPARMRDETVLSSVDSPVNRLALFGQWIYEVAAMADYAARGWLNHRHGRS